MSIDTKHVDWIKTRLDGLVVAIQVEGIIMDAFQHIMDVSPSLHEHTHETDARKMRVWIDARRMRDALRREEAALSAVIAEISVVE